VPCSHACVLHIKAQHAEPAASGTVSHAAQASRCGALTASHPPSMTPLYWKWMWSTSSRPTLAAMRQKVTKPAAWLA
jgi:hypothetical protein